MGFERRLTAQAVAGVASRNCEYRLDEEEGRKEKGRHAAGIVYPKLRGKKGREKERKRGGGGAAATATRAADQSARREIASSLV